MSEITVIRHSLALANEQGILMGAKLNSPLSEKGITIAHAKGAALKAEGYAPEKVFTSKLTRAKQTAEIILEELGLDIAITELEDLNERDFGVHDGKPYKSVIDAFEAYGENPPTVEPVDVFVKRVLSAFELIKKDTTTSTLVVTHSNPEMVLEAAVLQPEMINRFWELGDPSYCEGFTHTLPLKK